MSRAAKTICVKFLRVCVNICFHYSRENRSGSIGLYGKYISLCKKLSSPLTISFCIPTLVYESST